MTTTFRTSGTTGSRNNITLTRQGAVKKLGSISKAIKPLGVMAFFYGGLKPYKSHGTKIGSVVLCVIVILEQLHCY